MLLGAGVASARKGAGVYAFAMAEAIFSRFSGGKEDVALKEGLCSREKIGAVGSSFSTD